MDNISDNFFGDYQKDIVGYIQSVNNLSQSQYENIFKIGFDEKNTPFYNIAKTIVLPKNIDPSIFKYSKVLPTDTWTNLSYIYYGNIDLWWLLALVNNVTNPFIIPNVIKIVKPEYVDMIIDSIHSQLN